MKMFDIHGQYVTVDVRQSSYPIRGVSKSKLQQKAGEILQDKYPYDAILEEFIVPGSVRLSIDFFVPKKGLVIEIDGKQHDEFVPYFHGNKATSNAFAKQISFDRQKEFWAELNGFKFIRIKTDKDLQNL